MSKKLEMARNILNSRLITNQYNRVFSSIRNSIKDEYPDIYPDILKDIKNEEIMLKDNLSKLYSDKFTLRELLQIYNNIQTKQGRSIYKKTMELFNLSSKLGEEFVNKINLLIENKDAENRRNIIIGDKKCKVYGKEIPSKPRRL